MNEPFEKVQAPQGYWFVHQCGWGRRFATEEAADAHISLNQALTVARQHAKIKARLTSPVKAGRKRFDMGLDTSRSIC